MNLNYYELSVEITRKCNMKCAHCLRGDAQNKTISKEVIDSLLDQINSIGQLTLTGGEPFLEPEMIEYLFTGIIKRKIPILEVGCMTNGSIKSAALAHSFNKMAVYIAKVNPFKDDKEKFSRLVQFKMSKDPYHDKIDQDSFIDFYRHYANEHVCVDVRDGTGLVLTNTGRAESLKVQKRYRVTPYRVNVDDKTGSVGTSITIGYDGAFSVGGMKSYAQLDSNNYGNIMVTPMSDLIAKYGFKEPFTKAEAKKRDLVYTAWINKKTMDGKPATKRDIELDEAVLTMYDLIYSARKRLLEIYPLSYEEVVTAAYHEANCAIKESCGKDAVLLVIGTGEPFPATYEESYKKRLELQLRFPIQTLAARLKYRGATLDYEKVPNMK